MEGLILTMAPELECFTILDEAIKQAICANFKNTNFGDVIIIPEDIFQNVTSCKEWLEREDLYECLYFEAVLEDDEVEKQPLEEGCDDPPIPSPETLSSYSLGSSTSPGTASPYALFVPLDLYEESLKTAQEEVQKNSEQSSRKSPDSEYTDSGIADLDGSVLKSHSDETASLEDLCSFYEDIDLDEGASPPKPIDVVDIFFRKDAEFWYSSDDSQKYTSDHESHGICSYSSEKNRVRRIRRRKKKWMEEVVEIKNNQEEEEEDLDLPNIKIRGFEAIHRKLSKYRGQLRKNDAVEMSYDRWRARTEKLKLTRERKTDKRKLKHVFCRKEAQNAKYNQLRSTKKRPILLPEYF